MPSRSSEVRYDQNGGPRKITTQNGRHTVGMRMRFYEDKSRNEEQSALTNGGGGHAQRLAHLPTIQRQSGLEHEEHHIMDEPIYAKINKRNRRPKQTENDHKPSTSPEKPLKEIHIYDDVRDPRAPPRNGYTEQEGRHESRRRQRRKVKKQQSPEEVTTNGTHLDTPSKMPIEKTRSLPTQNGHLSVSNGGKEIAFLSGAEIGKIYQSSEARDERLTDKKVKNVNGLRSRSMVNMGTDSIDESLDPNDYQWKIVESKSALNELRKSLSNDNALDITNHDPVEREEISASRRAKRQRRKKRSTEKKVPNRSREDIMRQISKEVVYQPASKDDIIAVASNLFTGQSQGKISKLVLPPPIPVEARKHSEPNEEVRTGSHTEEHPARSDDLVTSIDHSTPVTSKDAGKESQDPRVKQLSSEHDTLSKKDSNNSLLSTTSGGSTMSKKLFTLSEDIPKQIPARSKKKFSKRFSWKNTSGYEDVESAEDSPLSQEEKKTRTKEEKKNRRTTSAIEYTLADVSPALVRSERSRTLPHIRSGKTFGEIVTPKHHQPLTPESENSAFSRDRSPPSSQTQTSSSQSSLIGGDPRLVFRVDLDKPYHRNADRKENRITAPRIKREIFESENGVRETKSKLMKDKRPK